METMNIYNEYYTFGDYNIDTKDTRKGKHNTLGYGCLGLIGELGELMVEIVERLPEPISEDEAIALEKIEQFIILSVEIESLKKTIRAKDNPIFVNPNINHSEELIEEIGGIFWYLNDVTEKLALSLGAIAYENQKMLRKRFNTNPGWMVSGIKTH